MLVRVRPSCPKMVNQRGIKDVNPPRLWQTGVHVLRGQQDSKSDTITCHHSKAENKKTSVLIVIPKCILFQMQHMLQHAALLPGEEQSLGLRSKQDSTCSHVGCGSCRECSWSWCIPC